MHYVNTMRLKDVMIKNNYIDKDIKEVGYRHVDDENYQSFYVTRMEDQFIIQYAETCKGDNIHAQFNSIQNYLVYHLSIILVPIK